MRNELRGLNALNELLWMAHTIKEENGEILWHSTGLKQPGITIHVDVRSVITYYLMGYPETDTIQGVLNDQYRMAIPANAAATTIVDAIMRELKVE